MGDKRKVYLVSSGSYSDYQVVAVYDEGHKEQAEHFAGLIDGGKVEEWTLNEYTTLPRIGHVLFTAKRFEDGAIEVKESYFHDLLDVEDGIEPKVERRESHGQYGSWRSRDRLWIEGGLHVRLYARDQDHALKIASDMFAEFLANESGIG